MIPRLGDGNKISEIMDGFKKSISLENDSPSRGRKLIVTTPLDIVSSKSLENDSPSRGRKQEEDRELTDEEIKEV